MPVRAWRLFVTAPGRRGRSAAADSSRRGATARSLPPAHILPPPNTLLTPTHFTMLRTALARATPAAAPRRAAPLLAARAKHTLPDLPYDYGVSGRSDTEP
jgi:hypothetical protein